MTITDEICAHVVAADYSLLDDFTVSRLKTRVLDAIGVIAAGAHAPLCDELFDLLKSYGTAAQSAAFFRSEKIDAPSAAMINSFSMRSYDFEAIEAENENRKSSAAHISGTTVPTAFACAERAGASGRDFMVALALGDDIAARLGAASGFDVYGGWDNTNTINGLGATVIAGKLAGLDERQLNNALGLDLNMLGGSMDNINYKTLAFKLPMALASRNAIFSADFAARGMTATHDAFGGKKGYFFLYCGEKQQPELLCKDLGKVFYGDVVIKPWSACRATHPSIDACLQIVAAHDIDPEQVSRVVVHTTPRTAQGFVGQPFDPGEEPQVSGAFSIIYTAAVAIATKTVRPDSMNLAAMQDPALKRLIEKIEIQPSLAPDEYQTAEADIVMADGAAYHARCDVPKGDIYKSPMSEEEVLDKFYRNIEFSQTLSRADADRVVKAVSRLEELDDIGELVAFMR
ncbi:MmgE/PrpD family protein [Raoultibacter phocaeensis]|uniref:MmgE/PrpD family protein n=1 Tax=Raoultibacter phocaeensis TaxID=2479841 RepID=UPI0015D58280|nr:MmgE/PrpD family protein [Raoultibacter phocaeensis]